MIIDISWSKPLPKCDEKIKKIRGLPYSTCLIALGTKLYPILNSSKLTEVLRNGSMKICLFRWNIAQSF